MLVHRSFCGNVPLTPCTSEYCTCLAAFAIIGLVYLFFCVSTGCNIVAHVGPTFIRPHPRHLRLAWPQSLFCYSFSSYLFSLCFSPIPLVSLVRSSIFTCMYWWQYESNAIYSAKSMSSRKLVNFHRISLLLSLARVFMTQSLPMWNRKGESLYHCFTPVVTVQEAVSSLLHITWEEKLLYITLITS